MKLGRDASNFFSTTTITTTIAAATIIIIITKLHKINLYFTSSQY